MALGMEYFLYALCHEFGAAFSFHAGSIMIGESKTQRDDGLVEARVTADPRGEHRHVRLVISVQ